jgi:hypothetical protein
VGRPESADAKKWGKREGDGPHGLDGVREDDLLVRVALLVVVPAVVDELHLLEYRRLYTVTSEAALRDAEHDRAHLAGFTGTEEEHLDLVLREHPVALQLGLDLVIACEGAGA